MSPYEICLSLKAKIFLVLSVCVLVTIYSLNKQNSDIKYSYTYNFQDGWTYNETLLRGAECASDSYPQRVVQKGDFWVINNFVTSSVTPKCMETITYTVPASFEFLENIIELVIRWEGPISVGLFAPGDDFIETVRTIAYLRNCKTDLVKKYVTFHVFFPEDHFPQISSALLSSYQDHFDCSEDPPYYSKSPSYRQKNNIQFPINVARNIARDNARTYLIFPSDIELYPSPGMIPKMLKMFSNKGLIPRSTVYVTPVFEVEELEKIPETKSEIRHLLQNERAQFFHRIMCAPCHSFPNQEKWILEDEDEELGIFESTKRTGSFAIWEPFYIGIKSDVPVFAEKVSWEGLSDKMVQAYILCLMNYEFAVLNNVFLIHKPGIKKHRNNPLEVVQATNQYRKNILRPVLDAIFGYNKDCVL